MDGLLLDLIGLHLDQPLVIDQHQPFRRQIVQQAGGRRMQCRDEQLGGSIFIEADPLFDQGGHLLRVFHQKFPRRRDQYLV